VRQLWLRQLDGGGYPLAVNLRPAADWPDRAVVAIGLARMVVVIGRLAATWTSSPAPDGLGIWRLPRRCPTRGRNAADGWPSRTWSSGPCHPAAPPLMREPSPSESKQGIT
jgi:hypothetical protein